MEVDAATRYRSRIIREMNANRENPFNSPPSSTGSHGTISPTMSSVFSDPDGESTRRLNEDIARATAPRGMPINFEAAHRKWPEYFSKPSKRRVSHAYEDDTDARPMSSESKENKPPALGLDFNDDSTQNIWLGSKRTRAEMQPRVDNESDISSIGARSPAKGMPFRAYMKHTHKPSPLAKAQRNISPTQEPASRKPSIQDALDRLRRASNSPRADEANSQLRHDREAIDMSSAKSSLTAVPPSPTSFASGHQLNGHSFVAPDATHLGDFVTGTLRYSGSTKNGVPILVKHGKVHDQAQNPSAVRHLEVDGLEIPEDEEKIFVSMDMIREEIMSLQGNYDKVSEYAENLQRQVDALQAQLRLGQTPSPQISRSHELEKKGLESEITTLKSRLDQASRSMSVHQIETDTMGQEKDRTMRKLQEACDDINKLTRKLSTREKELETTHRQLEVTDQMRFENNNLRQEVIALKHSRDSLELENTSLRTEMEALRQQKVQTVGSQGLKDENSQLRKDHQSLVSENTSLRANNHALLEGNEDLRESLDEAHHDLDAARENIEILQQRVDGIDQEMVSLKEDNESLVRHNESYFTENKLLRKENSGFERSIQTLHGENSKLKTEAKGLKRQSVSVTADKDQVAEDEQTEENMTSAFFIPDITMNSQQTGTEQPTETRDLPVPDFTAEDTQGSQFEDTEPIVQTQSRRSSSLSKSKSSRAQGNSQKVAFSLPNAEVNAKKTNTSLANQGNKRRPASMVEPPRKSIMLPDAEPLTDNDDSTGFQSLDFTGRSQSAPLSVAVSDRLGDFSQTGQNQDYSTRQSLHRRSKSRLSRHGVATATATETGCPALSKGARRVLDGLCDHNCRNCTVCSRITSHGGIVSSKELVGGKKRVSVPRPIPITDRDLTAEDPTMRPSQSPGHALALVIKGLEDEACHLQMELSRMQARYSSTDKAVGRRDRLALAESIRTLLKTVEAKNDQIYSLYDVLEGQKVAGQAMSEEEIEITVLNITGMTVRDVTSASEHTWEGIVEV